MSPGLEAVTLADNAQSAVETCTATPRTGTGDLERTAQQGVPLRFKCDAASSLSPSDAPLTKVYQYAAGDSKSCNTTTEFTLTDLVQGATLRQEEASGEPRATANPVYVFQYDEKQAADRYLCYTCNATEAKKFQAVEATQNVACTVYIKVPRTVDKPPTDSSTTPPDSPSSAPPAVSAAAAVAAGAFLSAMVRL